MFVKMKIKWFSKRKLNVRISKTKIKCAILGFSQNCCILGKSREKLVKFSKNSSKIQQILAKFATFCKNQQKIQQFLTKKLRLENGAKAQAQGSRVRACMSAQNERRVRVVPYHAWILDFQDVAAFLWRRIGRAWPALVRVYFFVDWTCNLCPGRVDFRAYLGRNFPRPRIRRDTIENVELADFFELRGLFDDSDGLPSDSDASPDMDASDD